MSLLDATIGGSSANSYVTRQESVNYFQFTVHPQSETWARLEYQYKDAYLIQATRDIEMQRLDGGKRTATTTSGVADQALHFPRSRDYDNGVEFIPVEVKDACCEQALHIAVRGSGSRMRQELQADGVIEISYDDVTEKYSPSNNSRTGILCPNAKMLLVKARILVTSGAIRT